MNHFSIGLWHAVKRYCKKLVTARLVAEGRSPKALTKSKLAPQKSHGHCLLACCPSDPYSFLNPGKTITSERYARQIEEMHRKLWCLQLALANRLGPILPHNNAQQHVTQPHFKVEQTGLRSFFSSAIFTWPIDYHVFKHHPNFLQEKCFHNKEAENAFQEFTESWSTNVYATGINKLVGKNVLTVMVPILINKDVFEPSYNDLKFMVRSQNYFFTNLVYTYEPKWISVF